MKNAVSVALLSAMICLCTSVSAVAHDGGSWEHKNKYLRAQMTKLGASPGCDLVADQCKDTKRTGDNVREYFATMRRAIAPPSPPEPVTPAATQTAPTSEGASASSYGGGNYSIPSYIVQCESGGDYNARNPSGAYGAYQIMPGTAQAYGCDLSTPGGQDSCAAKIYAREGAAPWSCG